MISELKLMRLNLVSSINELDKIIDEVEDNGGIKLSDTNLSLKIVNILKDKKGITNLKELGRLRSCEVSEIPKISKKDYKEILYFLKKQRICILN